MAINERLVLAIKNDFLFKLTARKLLEKKQLNSTVDLKREFFDYLAEEQYYDFEHIQAVAKDIQRHAGIRGANLYHITYETITTEFAKRLNNDKLNQAVNEFALWIRSLNKSDLKKEEFSLDKKKYCPEKVLWYFFTEKVNLAHIQGYVGFCVFVKQLKDRALILNWKKNRIFPPSLEEFKQYFEKAKNRTKDRMVLESLLVRIEGQTFSKTSNMLRTLLIALVFISNISRYLIASYNNKPKPILNCWREEMGGSHQILNLLCDTSEFYLLKECMKLREENDCTTSSFTHLTNGTIEMSLWRSKQKNESPNLCTLSTFFDCAGESFSGNYRQLPKYS